MKEITPENADYIQKRMFHLETIFDVMEKALEDERNVARDEHQRDDLLQILVEVGQKARAEAGEALEPFLQVEEANNG